MSFVSRTDKQALHLSARTAYGKAVTGTRRRGKVRRSKNRSLITPNRCFALALNQDFKITLGRNSEALPPNLIPYPRHRPLY